MKVGEGRCIFNMKRTILSFFLLLSAALCWGQYYNHNVETCPGVVACGACFGTGICYGYVCMACGGTGAVQCAACAGYYAGKRMAEMQKRNGNSAGGGSVYVPPSSSNSPSSSGGVYSTCRICGGSGVCTSCNGRGGEFRDTGYYSGTNTKSWINCPSCNGNKRCFNCHGTGRQ